MFTKKLVFKDKPVGISFTSTLSAGGGGGGGGGGGEGRGGGGRGGGGGGGGGVLGVRGGVVAQCATYFRFFDHYILIGGAMKLTFPLIL